MTIDYSENDKEIRAARKRLNFEWHCACGRKLRGDAAFGYHKKTCAAYIANPAAAERVPSLIY